ncbi:MAG TPA: caspase family protein [Rubrobacter sp.]|nr:caspase family protein [Rubrobacter sp.]
MATKIALCIGQNEYDPSTRVTPLRGCVNDTLLIGEMLRRAGFEVRQIHNQAATQRGILDRLSTEVAKLREGDYFVFWNSSHGYQLNDREGDELYDYLDEAICTYDTDPRDPLTDDKLGRIVYRADPKATVFLGSDSCHSGSLTRAMLEDQTGNGGPKPRLWIPPDDVRFRSGTTLIDLDAFAEGSEKSLVDHKASGKEAVEQIQPTKQELRRFGHVGREIEEKEMGHLLLSGCRPEQTSADAPFPEGWYGAMTYNFAKAVLRAWRSGNAITYGEAHKAALAGLEQGEFEQKPQLEGPDQLKDTPVFGFKP